MLANICFKKPSKKFPKTHFQNGFKNHTKVHLPSTLILCASSSVFWCIHVPTNYNSWVSGFTKESYQSQWPASFIRSRMVLASTSLPITYYGDFKSARLCAKTRKSIVGNRSNWIRKSIFLLKRVNALKLMEDIL